MVRERYVSDNPFRLLDVPSGEGYPSLRRRADAVTRSIQVGIPLDVPLSQAFGSDLGDIQSQVRALTTNPESLTLYRMLWPIDAEGAKVLSAICESVVRGSERDEVGPPEETLDRAIKSEPTLAKGQTFSSWSAVGDIKSLSTLHTGFLGSWYPFVLAPHNDHLQRAIEAMTLLGETKPYLELLRRRLIDDGIDERTARSAVGDAGAALVRHVCARGVEAATEEWQRGRRAEASRLLRTSRSAPLDEADEEAALHAILGLGDRLASDLETIAAPPAAQIAGPAPLCLEVEELASAVGRHPRVSRWLDYTLEHRTRLASALRDKGIEIANENKEYASAIEFTRRAQALKPSGPMLAALAKDFKVLQGNLRSSKEDAAWEGITPVHSAPGLRTVNGIGCTMYGSTPFEGDRRYVLSNLYFTFLFFPVFPLARYLVQREGSSYRFCGQAPWTKTMKFHLGTSLAGIASGILWMALSSSSSSAASYSEPGASASNYTSDPYTPPSPSPVSVSSSAPSAQSQTTPPPKGENFDDWVKEHGDSYEPSFETEPKRTKLKKELDELKRELDMLDAEIDESQKNIDTTRANLKSLRANIEGAAVDKTNSFEIDLHNRDVDEYERKRATFNAMVKAHNRMVERNKRKVKRHNEIVRELNAEAGA